MANLSNINNILRISSSGVGLNKNNTGPSELDIESAGADIIDMTRTNLKTYRFAISGASAFSLFDVAANADRLVINSAGNATFAGDVTLGSWLKGSSGTNAFYSATSYGTLLNSPTNSGAGANIYFRNSTGTVFQTFSQSDGSATFAGDTQAQKVTSTKGFFATGNINAPASGTSALIMDYYLGNSRFWSRGANATTKGGFQFIQLENDGGGQTTPLAIDSSGRVGIGITPFAWDSSFNNIQIGNKISLWNASNNGGLSFNQYYNGTNNIYQTNGTANRLQMDADGFHFYQASSGTAGNTATFAEKMLIDSNGVIQLTSGINGYLNTNSIGMEMDINRNPETGAFKDAGLSHARIIMRGDTTANGGSNIKFVTSPTVNTVGATKMTITGGGNVGIGVVNPETARLLVRGSTNDSASQIFQAANLGGASKYVIRADGDNKWYKGDNSLAMVLTSTGSVGIGTTTTNTTLNLYSASNTQIGFQDASTGTTSSDGFRVGYNGSVAQLYLFENADMRFATNDIERMRITSTGVTAIGMTNATGAATIRVSGVGNATGNGTGNIQFVNSNSYPSWQISAGGTPTGALAFTQSATYGASDFSVERMRITNGGEVQIAGKLTAGNAAISDYKYTSYGTAGLNTTGVVVATVTGAGNGSSASIEFVGMGGVNGIVDVVYNCTNQGGNWYAYKNERQSPFGIDVVATGNGTTTLTFTFKAISSTQGYTPRVRMIGGPNALVTF